MRAQSPVRLTTADANRLGIKVQFYEEGKSIAVGGGVVNEELKPAVVAPVEPREPTYAASTPSPVTTSASARQPVHRLAEIDNDLPATVLGDRDRKLALVIRSHRQRLHTRIIL